MDKECSFSELTKYKQVKSNIFKNPAVNALQDLLFYQILGLAFFMKNILTFNKYDAEVNNQLTRLLYLTNKKINFSISAMTNAISEADELRNRMENLYRFLCKSNEKRIKKYPFLVKFKLGETLSQMVSQSNALNIQKVINSSDFNINSMKELIRLSISASANYLEHIKNDDVISQEIYTMLYDILEFLGRDTVNLDSCKDYALKAGELQTQILEIVVTSYEKTYGLIERKKITTDYIKGSAILVAGEDFNFLQNLLKETEDKDINIYTYGVLNYAHVFPEINKYKNLVGIYRGKYNNFSSDIEFFPGVVVLTSGNIEELREIFRGRIFSTEDISMLGVKKIKRNDFKTIINAAYDAQGFTEYQKNCYIEMGFGLLELEKTSNELYDLLDNKKIDNIWVFLDCNDFDFDKHFHLKYSDTKQDKNVAILINSIFWDNNSSDKIFTKIINLGNFINLYTLLRLLYSLAGKFRRDINDMPINIVVDLHAQESIATLFMLFSLGIYNVKIISDLPNYLTDTVLNNFSEEYNVQKLHKTNINIFSKKQA